jgi:hypothetical protein
MSKRYKDKGRIGGPFVPLLKETMSALAWKTMSPFGRLLYIALKARYGIDLKNNGRIYLSVRTGAKETGLDKDTISRAFHENVHYGFIRMTVPGCLGLEGRGKAPHWRLTELGYMTDPPTRDFMRWDGTIFEGPKKQKPVPSKPTDCPVQPDIPLSRPTGQLAAELSRPTGHTDSQACPAQPDISRLTTTAVSRSAPHSAVASETAGQASAAEPKPIGRVSDAFLKSEARRRPH